MLWVPQKGTVKRITNSGIVGTATPGTGVPSSGTTLLDGTVTEVISAAANVQDSWGIYISIQSTGTGATASEACMDVLIGGATDDVLIAALIAGYAGRFGGIHYFFPLHIPQGKRIAMTHANVRTSVTAQVMVTLFGGSPPPWRVGRKVTTYGTQINNARGQAVTPAESGAAATVTEMTSSTGAAHFALLPGIQPATDTTITTGHLNVGIGVGASTEDRIGTWWVDTASTEEIHGPLPSFPAFYDVPASSRLSLLVSNSVANDAAYDGLIYAVS
jgi:hypothetical protein